MKIKINWISVILRFVKTQFLRKYFLIGKPFLTRLMSLKAGRVENNNINYDSIENTSYGYGSLEISIEDSYNEEFLGEQDEDKNQIDKYNIEICNTTVSFKTDNVEDNNINDDSIRNNNCGSSEINIKENNLEYKKHDSPKNDKLENKNCTSIEDSYNEEYEDENKVNTCNIEICKITVSSETLPICENNPHTSDVTVGPVTVKIPVVLTQCNITVAVQSSLKLEDNILEIKHIRKNVYLNQCKLIPNSKTDKPNTGMVFLAGFIRKNIEYFTKDHNYKEGLSGKLKNATVNVPFNCTTRVTFNTAPKIKATTSQDEVEILQTNIEICNPYEEEISGGDIREQSFRLIEFFNDKLFCELISAEFVESDILENEINKVCKVPLEQPFNYITEKVVLLLTIKLLQNQNVIISK